MSMSESHPKTSKIWTGFKDDPEKPLTAILTLNTIAHTVGALGVGGQVVRIYADNPVSYTHLTLPTICSV